MASERGPVDALVSTLVQTTTDLRYKTGAHLVPSSRWRAIALVYGSHFVQLVIDGVIVYEVPVSGALKFENVQAFGGGSFGVQLGGSAAQKERAFRGALDEIAIWAEARTVAQLSTEHLSLLPLDPRGGKEGAKNVPKKMLAYWPMNDGWGSGLTDATGRGYDCVGAKAKSTWLASTAPSPGETRMCTVAGIRCEPSYAYKGQTYFGCTGQHYGGKPWCYTDESRKIWGVCAFTCDLSPSGGFPGHFTKTGNHESGVGSALFSAFAVIVALAAAAAAAFLGVRFLSRRSGGSSTRPSSFSLPFSLSNARDFCENALEKVSDFCRDFARGLFAFRQRDVPKRETAARGGSGGFGGGGYGRNYDGDEGAPRTQPQSSAQGGVRNSLGARDAGAAGGFEQFQDDML